MESPLLSLIKNCEVAITYKPLQGEVAYSLPISLSQITLPTDKNADPFKTAQKCIEEVGSRSVCILIPGTLFDAKGTRHGRGVGWYDRFLSEVPRTWLRIGVLDESQLSPTTLVREPWDEPTDWLVLKAEGNWRYVETDTRPTNSK